jgi:SAM-dependent methyltransferase
MPEPLTSEHPYGMSKKHYSLITACEACLTKYGDSFLGVGWTRRQQDADTRYRVMLELIDSARGQPLTILDFGCGASHLYEYILRTARKDVQYAGLDLSTKFLELSRKKHPEITYYDVDILDDPAALPQFDYVIMNGIFTWKCALSFDEMLDYFKALVGKAFAIARIGIAFNVMSTQVDWQRDDLFHLPFDVLASFLTNEISRHFVIRHDYGLFEYTAYVYRQPNNTSA